ncbi:acetylglutamate kinase [Candidatus Gottesmanbacteria bacterium]|nr:acetylglutamate kinase [Candidatus Gottesmanbacteria bacterium]
MKKIIVIKLGGQVIKEKKYFIPLLEAIVGCVKKGFYVVVIHGGGPQADEMQIKLGIPMEKVNGKRITNRETLEVVKMVYRGKINLDIVADCLKLHIPAVGISGVDGGLILAERRPVANVLDHKTGKKKEVDFGSVGDIKYINTKLLEIILKEGYLPVVACLGVSDMSEILNINADTFAVHISLSLKAEKLIFVTDVKGVFGGSQKYSYEKHLTLGQAKGLISNGVVSHGMIPKIENVERALIGGVKTIIVGQLDTKKKWSDALLNNSHGTVITKN